MINDSTSIRVVDIPNQYTGNVLPDFLVNGYSALTIPAYWRAMAFISDNMARFPRYVRDPRAQPDDPPHPLTRLLSVRPNGYTNPFTFWRAFIFHFAHTGDGCARIERGPNGQPIAFHNCQPEDVLPFRYTPDGSTTPEQYYLLRDPRMVIHHSDMIHLSGLSWDGMRGLDPVSVHAGTFARAGTIDRYQTRFLLKGTVIKGSIEIPQSISDERLDQIKAYLKQAFYGIDANEDVIVLSDGAKLNNSTLSPQESQMIQQAQYSTKQIGQITGVSPEFLFELSEAKYNASVELAGQFAVRYTFGPIIEQLEDELSLKLLSPAELDAGLRVRLNPDALIRGDTQTQTTTVIASVNGGIRSKNEGRALLDLPPDPDPESDKLHVLGSNQPATTTAPAPAAGSKSSAFNILQPVIDAACNRVDTKTAKAFTNAEKKSGSERTVWSNVFAEEQGNFVRDALAPVAAALAAIDPAVTLDVEQIATKYAEHVRRRAIDGNVVKLSAWLN